MGRHMHASHTQAWPRYVPVDRLVPNEVSTTGCVPSDTFLRALNCDQRDYSIRTAPHEIKHISNHPRTTTPTADVLTYRLLLRQHREAHQVSIPHAHQQVPGLHRISIRWRMSQAGPSGAMIQAAIHASLMEQTRPHLPLTCAQTALIEG